MATYSSTLAWRISWTEEPGRLQSMGSQRVRHDWVTSLSLWLPQVAQMLKRLPTMRETQVRSLGWEDSLEKEMATHSSILAFKISWTEEPGRLQPMGSQRVTHNSTTWLSFLLFPKITVQFLCASVSTGVSASRASRWPLYWNMGASWSPFMKMFYSFSSLESS